jgi:trehalose 6-phosphate phosphatase
MPAPAAETLDQVLSPLRADPGRSAILCDIDGTLAPIVDDEADARVAPETARLLGQLARRYALAACVSGRRAASARQLVGVGSLVYAGLHGAELLEPGAAGPTLNPEAEGWTERVQRFVAGASDGHRLLRIRAEDKGPVVAFHWRGAPDEPAARRRLEAVAEAAGQEGLVAVWGRKVMEIRPPEGVGKGLAVRTLLSRPQIRLALYAGDDTTDLDSFDALDALVAERQLDAAIRVGVRSAEGPAGITERADLVVEGVDGFARVLEALAT